MTIEYSIPRSTKVVFEEAKPYSYVVTPINLIDKIFENYNKYDIKTLTLKLLDSAVNPDFLSKKITIGAQAFEDSEACTNRLIRETCFEVRNSNSWTLLQKLLFKTSKPNELLSLLNKNGFIDKDLDQWEILRYLINEGNH